METKDGRNDSPAILTGDELAQVTGGGSEGSGYFEGDWVRVREWVECLGFCADAGYCVTGVSDDGQYKVTKFFVDARSVVWSCSTQLLSADLLESAAAPVWAEQAMEFLKQHGENGCL